MIESMALDDLRNEALTGQLQHTLDHKTKPLGALGILEGLALKLGQILGSTAPQLQQPQMVVFAADHGLAARGVSAYPGDVTWQMVHNFLSGGAAVSVLARQHGLSLTVVDAGVRHDFQPQAGLQIRKIGPGTADSLEGPAMSIQDCERAMAQGREVVRSLPGNVILFGEMGIGNTSAASMLLSRLTGLPIDSVTGRGTGLDDEGLQRKRDILQQVLTRHADARTPLAALAALGGFEIAMMVGALLQAAQERRVIVVDGFIVGSALLVAHALQPHVLQRCVFAHQSGEPGHEKLLQYLQAQPLLSWQMRLGEGSGAALVWPLIESACRILREMASFESAGVSQQVS